MTTPYTSGQRVSAITRETGRFVARFIRHGRTSIGGRGTSWVSAVEPDRGNSCGLFLVFTDELEPIPTTGRAA